MVTNTRIPTGYKQMDVGVIPEDWEEHTFGDLIDYTKGFAFKSASYRDNGVRIIRVSDTSFDSISDDEAVYISEAEAKQYEKWKLVEADLVFSTVGSKPPMYDSLVGRATYISRDYSGSLLNQNAVRIRYKSKSLHKQIFLLNNFRTQRYINFIEQIYRGNANQASITLKDLFDYKLAIPKKEIELQNIAQVLLDIDEFITKLGDPIEKKRNIKRGTMQELLTGKRRLSGFRGKWERKTLGKLGDITGSGVDKKIRPDEVPVRLVNFLDVFHKNFIYSKDLHHQVTARPDQLLRCSVKKGDIFFTPSSEMPFDIGISAIAMEDIPGAVHSYHVDRLRLFEDWDLLFRAYIFQTKDFSNQTATQCEGSGKRYVLNLTTFRERLTVYYPTDNKEQTAIAKILFDMDTEIEKLESQLTKYQNIKQGMMQQLLTGRIRIYANN